MQAVLTDDDALDTIFEGTNLPGSEKTHFHQFLQGDSGTALVFRAERKGDHDRDLLAFDGDWNGDHRRVVISAEFEVNQKDTGWQVRLVFISGDDQSDDDQVLSPKIEFSSLTGTNRMEPTLPLYLLRLVWQLTNWRKSLE